MPDNVLIFEEFANSGKGFLARPVLPDNNPALRVKIGEVSYTVKDMTTGGLVTGDLDPEIVMMAALVTWKYDKIGYSFFWAVPGILWPTAGHSFRVVVDYLVEDPGTQLDGFAFKLAWQNDCVDPLG